AAALEELHIPPHVVAAVGDAENDLTFMRTSGLSAAVANALPSVKAIAHIVLGSGNGEGVAELAGPLLGEGSLHGPARSDAVVWYDYNACTSVPRAEVRVGGNLTRLGSIAGGRGWCGRRIEQWQRRIRSERSTRPTFPAPPIRRINICSTSTRAR